MKGACDGGRSRYHSRRSWHRGKKEGATGGNRSMALEYGYDATGKENPVAECRRPRQAATDRGMKMRKLTSNWPMSGTLHSPDQHRQMAANIRKHAGKPGAPEKAEAENMAKAHEGLAKMIEDRLAAHAAGMLASPQKDILPGFHNASPSIAPKGSS
jgi:hypothetical protein